MSSSDEEMLSDHERAPTHEESDDAVSSRHNSEEEEEEEHASPRRRDSEEEAKNVPPISYVPSDSDEELEQERQAARMKALQQTEKAPAPKQLDSDDSDVPSERQNSEAEMHSDDDHRDSEPEEEEEQERRGQSSKKSDHQQIFGDLSDSDDGSDREQAKRDFTEDDIVGPRLYPDTDEQADEAIPEDMNVFTHRTMADLGKEALLFVKFPNFLSVETKPFSPEFYEDEVDEEENVDEEGRQRLKLKVENTIRWRKTMNRDGTEVRESNAKIVRWSDGTMSLYLGSEIFELTVQPLHEHNHLYIRQGAGLQGLSVFKKRVVFRPHSTETLTHRKMTLNMAERSNKSQRVKVLNVVGSNPEEMKRDMIRKEEEKLRAAARRETQQRKLKDRQRPSGLTPGFLEGGGGGYDSDEGESLGAIKNRYKSRVEAPLLGQSSDEESDGGNRLDKAKLDSEEDSSDVEAHERDQKGSRKKKIVSDEESD
ncbi:hypothetical protein QR680_012589 [Steinernema hermaphroditum]|uniref:RNA polymerase-associated protein LEO1 n=1 Tax=Steinernema hermaphroditum TaxID=289476 RepID=A0AA39I4H3_9BILA|nr:hypothetical protein QR680_012589 [Steinernema hermaphroditum]